MLVKIKEKTEGKFFDHRGMQSLFLDSETVCLQVDKNSRSRTVSVFVCDLICDFKEEDVISYD